MKADPDQQLLLLDLARLDAEANTLATRARTLPARAEHEQQKTTLEALRADLAAREEDAAAARRALTAHADRSEALRTRIDREQADLEAGRGPSRELLALQNSLATQREQLSGYDDAEVELMEAAEAADATREGAQRDADAAQTDLDTLTASVRQQVAALKEQHAAARARREHLAAHIDERLLSAYEKVAAQQVTGATAVQDGACAGCGMELAPAARSALASAAADELRSCEECGRFLVRSA